MATFQFLVSGGNCFLRNLLFKKNHFPFRLSVCVAGRYRNETCLPCAMETFKNDTGDEACSPCAVNMTTMNTSSTECGTSERSCRIGVTKIVPCCAKLLLDAVRWLTVVSALMCLERSCPSLLWFVGDPQREGIGVTVVTACVEND